MHPLFAKLQKHQFPTHPDSNIPLVILLTKLSLSMNQTTIRFHNGKFKPCKSDRISCTLRIIAISTLLVHLSLLLYWFHTNWSNTLEPVDNWKYLFITYFIALFGPALFTIQHVDRVKKELIMLLNSSLIFENDCRANSGW